MWTINYSIFNRGKSVLQFTYVKQKKNLYLCVKNNDQLFTRVICKILHFIENKNSTLFLTCVKHKIHNIKWEIYTQIYIWNIENSNFVLESLCYHFHWWNMENFIFQRGKLHACIHMWNVEPYASCSKILPICQYVTFREFHI